MIFICLTGQDKTLNLRYKQIIIIPHPDFRPTTTWVHYTSNCKTQSSAPEDGQIIARNMLSSLKLLIKLSLLHLVGYRYYLYEAWTVKKISNKKKVGTYPNRWT